MLELAKTPTSFKRHMSTSHQNVQLYRKVTQEALVQCHRIYSGQNHEFTVMIEGIVTTLDVREILTASGLKTLMGENYMSNSEVRAAVLCYESVFFAHFGEQHALLQGLKETIADSLCFKRPGGATEDEINTKMLIPPEVREHHATFEEAMDAMEFNRWLISLLALILWSRPVFTFELDKAGAPTGRVIPAT